MKKDPSQNWKTRLRGLVNKIQLSSSDLTAGRNSAIRQPSQNCDYSERWQHSFYRRQLEKNLAGFERFARQSQSGEILDVFARGASLGRLDFLDIVDEIHTLAQSPETTLRNLDCKYEIQILLALASILTTRAQGDLDTHIGVQIYDLVRVYYGTSRLSDDHQLQYIEALGILRRYTKQEELVSELSLASKNGLQVRLLELERVRQHEPEDGWLAVLNDLYSSAGLSTIKLVGVESLPLLDRVCAASKSVVDGPKISVIMPTYSPGQGIFTALGSLLAQSWRNVEIIVVDDGSGPEHESIFSSVASMDPRVQVVKLQSNAGPYVARNVGLKLAKGAFITTHDDDDWSHPDKLAMQVQPLLEDSNLVATTSLHVRTTEDMIFTRINTKAVHAQKNYSSLMFRRRVVDSIGGWDTVNRGGDSEYEARLISQFGKSRKHDLKVAPLAFSRVWSGSLTSGEMRRGYQAPARQLYYQAYSAWHKEAKRRKSSLNLASYERRPYPVPTTLEAGMRNIDLGLFDVLFVSDYYSSSKHVTAVLHNLEAAVDAGLRVAYMQLESPQTGARDRISHRLLEIQQAGLITQVSHDDVAETRLLVVYDAAIGMFVDTLRSSVRAHRAILIHDEHPRLKEKPERSPVQFYTAMKNLDRCFNTVFCSTATSQILVKEIQEMIPPTRMIENGVVWNTPFLSNVKSSIRPPQTQPIIGYHSFGNMLRWPSTRKTFETVYVSPEYFTMFYGHLKPARQKFGNELVRQIELVDSNALAVEEYLHQIDFWVYFPDDRLVEIQPTLPVLEAMYAGKVVVLPHCLERIYGDAALYTEPEGVGSVVRQFSEDRLMYKRQALTAQDFSSRAYTHEGYARMLSRLIK